MKTKILMKGLVVLAILLTSITGCKKNDSLMGPDQNMQVSFQISQQQGINGGVQFLFKPSSDTKISRIVSKFPAEQFADTMSYTNPNYIYSKDTTYIINEYTGVQQEQQWKFDFSGNTQSGTNSGYNVTTDYTVQ
ncbi:MAG: hypothetical protein EHM58_03625 [Ignavibacteriae bacterium]|nr:MAG: hypothetical protein EHM58_03625 [Ignavibacteriota bacterium]